MSAESKCPFFQSKQNTAREVYHNFFPEKLDLDPLNEKNKNSPLVDKSFDYGEAFKTLDLEEVKKDITTVLTTPQPWWPADWGNYAPFMVRMAWHVAGTYRASDGRGGEFKIIVGAIFERRCIVTNGILLVLFSSVLQEEILAIRDVSSCCLRCCSTLNKCHYFLLTTTFFCCAFSIDLCNQCSSPFEQLAR